METVLKQLFLYEYVRSQYEVQYFSGLTGNDLSKCASGIGNYSDDSHDRFIAFVFMQEIMMLNSSVVYSLFRKYDTSSASETSPLGKGLDALLSHATTKSKSLTDQRNTLPHPQDISFAAFLASSATLRKKFITKLHACKLAVPFLLPGREGIEFIKHGLEGVVLPIRGPPSKEVVATNHQLTVISFLRLSNDCQISKSKCLNDLLYSDSGKSHDTFFHRDSPCGHKKRLISNGLVEGSWFLPSSSTSQDTPLESEILFLNLRGNAYNFSETSSVPRTIFLFIGCLC